MIYLSIFSYSCTVMPLIMSLTFEVLMCSSICAGNRSFLSSFTASSTTSYRFSVSFITLFTDSVFAWLFLDSNLDALDALDLTSTASSDGAFAGEAAFSSLAGDSTSTGLTWSADYDLLGFDDCFVFLAFSTNFWLLLAIIWSVITFLCSCWFSNKWHSAAFMGFLS